MASPQNIDERINDLEERLAFTDDLVLKLDDALANQQRQIMDLEHRIAVMMEHLQKLESGLPENARGNPIDEKPPHY